MNVADAQTWLILMAQVSIGVIAVLIVLVWCEGRGIDDRDDDSDRGPRR